MSEFYVFLAVYALFTAISIGADRRIRQAMAEDARARAVFLKELELRTTQIRREKEEELIFRGLQYAEAIRIFQIRFQRLPTTLKELRDVTPRSIRQLWKDPMTEDGEFAPIYQGQGTPLQPPTNPNNPPVPNEAGGGAPNGQTGITAATGTLSFVAVRSAVSDARFGASNTMAS